MAGGDISDQSLLQALTEAVNGQSRSMLAVMQGMQTEISKVAEKMDKLTDKVDEAHTRLITLEQQRHGKDIADLRQRIDTVEERLSTLETAKTKIEGAAIAAETLRSWAPFWLLFAGIIAAYFGLKPVVNPGP